mmetsp:Transcript_53271/g.161777  ORF Transcript_53271/g.161777 Transcript_53271/m.161777 type:complete len:220 (+) Transcript_53271:227-886(+)
MSGALWSRARCSKCNFRTLSNTSPCSFVRGKRSAKSASAMIVSWAALVRRSRTNALAAPASPAEKQAWRSSKSNFAGGEPGLNLTTASISEGALSPWARTSPASRWSCWSVTTAVGSSPPKNKVTRSSQPPSLLSPAGCFLRSPTKGTVYTHCSLTCATCTSAERWKGTTCKSTPFSAATRTLIFLVSPTNLLGFSCIASSVPWTCKRKASSAARFKLP